jgi:hypothetical protein
MVSTSGRSVLLVAALQAAIGLAALASSPAAALAATAIGALAVGRYAALAFFAQSLGPGGRAPLRAFAVSAWILGLFALAAAVGAVAIKARPALPWAVAAALAGPLGMSILAMGTGIKALTASGAATGPASGPGRGPAGSGPGEGSRP